MGLGDTAVNQMRSLFFLSYGLMGKGTVWTNAHIAN